MPAKFSSARMITIMVFAVSVLLPIAVFAQAAANLPVLAPGLHSLTLLRANEPAIHYAISIPGNYSPPARVPLILALHFGVRGGDSAGAGRDVVEILIGPALAELGAIIVAPDSMRGDWSSPENERAVNALLDMVLAGYSVDTKKSRSPASAWVARAPGILQQNIRNVLAPRSQSPAARRHLRPGGAFRFWPSIPATTRSHRSAQRKRESQSFRNPA